MGHLQRGHCQAPQLQERPIFSIFSIFRESRLGCSLQTKQIIKSVGHRRIAKILGATGYQETGQMFQQFTGFLDDKTAVGWAVNETGIIAEKLLRKNWLILMQTKFKTRMLLLGEL